ncbi:MAG: AraC family transcriptional regulator [Acidobacteriaceae bacterium]|nr:AraC family transcriptional regulator [Acidobacteriaceae bacterium]
MKPLQQKTLSRRIGSVPLTFAMDMRGDRFNSTGSRISLRVSLPLPGAEIRIAAGIIAVLVQIEPEARLASQGAAKSYLAGKAGDTCSFSSGTHVITEVFSVGTVMRFDVARADFKTFAQVECRADVCTFEIPAGRQDPTLLFFAKAIRPLLLARAMSREFSRHFTSTFYSHLLVAYAVAGVDVARFSGGFSPRNHAKIIALLAEDTRAKLSLKGCASACALSERHFARVFHESYGIPFHKFQLNKRINRAKHLLMETDLPLKVIATHAGYADQSTFTESFTRESGLAPGRYRRLHQSVADTSMTHPR